MLELNRFYNMDCMEGMKQFPNKYFDLAIPGPPYFDGPNKRGFYGKEINTLNIRRVDYPKIQTWELPTEEYFAELQRVSKHQIVWGCNYFQHQFGPGRIVWDKCNGESSFSDCEIAYCSLHDSVRLFKYMWNGMMQGKSISEGWIQKGNKQKNEVRIHPCQKPIPLYDWLLITYAKPGWKILDTHVGSASSLISCYNNGFDYVGFEIDPTIYRLASNRLETVMAQQSLFRINGQSKFA